MAFDMASDRVALRLQHMYIEIFQERQQGKEIGKRNLFTQKGCAMCPCQQILYDAMVIKEKKKKKI